MDSQEFRQILANDLKSTSNRFQIRPDYGLMISAIKCLGGPYQCWHRLLMNRLIPALGGLMERFVLPALSTMVPLLVRKLGIINISPSCLDWMCGIFAIGGFSHVVEFAFYATKRVLQRSQQMRQRASIPAMDVDPCVEGFPGRSQRPVNWPVFVHLAVNVAEEFLAEVIAEIGFWGDVRAMRRPCIEERFRREMSESIGEFVRPKCSVEEEDAGRKNSLLQASGGCQPTDTLIISLCMLDQGVNTPRSPRQIRIQNPFPVRPEATERHAEGEAQMIGRRLGIELRFVLRKRSPLRPIHRHLSPLLSMPPRRRAGEFEFDGGFVDGEGGFDLREDFVCTDDGEERKAVNITGLEVNPRVQ